MRLLFSAPRSIGSRLIRWFTWSEWSHVDVVMGRQVYGAVFPRGVRWDSVAAQVQRSTRHEYVDIQLTPEQEQAANAWLMDQGGKGYDWTAILGFLFRRNWQDEGRWFCSELVAAALDHAGHPVIKRESWRVSPQALYESICSWGHAPAHH